MYSMRWQPSTEGEYSAWIQFKAMRGLNTEFRDSPRDGS